MQTGCNGHDSGAFFVVWFYWQSNETCPSWINKYYVFTVRHHRSKVVWGITPSETKTKHFNLAESLWAPKKIPPVFQPHPLCCFGSAILRNILQHLVPRCAPNNERTLWKYLNDNKCNAFGHHTTTAVRFRVFVPALGVYLLCVCVRERSLVDISLFWFSVFWRTLGSPLCARGRWHHEM